MKQQSKTEIRICIHCGQPIPSHRKDNFCCSGCQIVYQLLMNEGLDQFYQLKPKKILPLVQYFSRQTDLDWVDQLPHLSKGTADIAIEGIQCAACVWVLEKLAKRYGFARVSINATLGRMHIEFDPKNFDLKTYLAEIQKFGYRTSDLTKNKENPISGLLLRLGVCTAIAMNTMFFSISMYLGLSDREDLLFQLFQQLNYYLSFLSVLVGGSYFFKRAISGLRKKILHFDLPIAIGILSAFLGSVYSHVQHLDDATFFDSLNIFIALMLFGRYLQEKFLISNRRHLLRSESLDQLKVTLLQTQPVEIKFSEVRKGHHLLIQSGALIPVTSRVVNRDKVECSLSSLTGEPEPQLFQKEDDIPAGARLSSRYSVVVEALHDFDESFLATLTQSSHNDEKLSSLWQWVAQWYVILVLTCAFLAFGIWLLIDPLQAPYVFISILVVTCPCSLGIAIPLARTMANRSLILRGVFERKAGFLDSLLQIQNIFFDKTGTLTMASMHLLNGEVVDQLPPYDRQILFCAVAQSRHPASQAVYEYLLSSQLPWLELSVEEIPGEGLHIDDGENRYFVGRLSNQGVQNFGYEVSFQKNDEEIIRIELSEVILSDTIHAIDDLKKMGQRIHLLSGDKRGRVEDLARDLNISQEQVYAECRPEEKGQIVGRLSHTLMIGDGLNDAVAFERASLSGSPVWERSPLTEKADFFFISGSLLWLPECFQLARKLKKSINFNLAFATIYNIGVVSLAAMGMLTPLICAIVMPLSSLTVVGMTVRLMKDTA